jgi:5-methylcytosine-specific restriction enzyme subunit McrC
VSVAAVRPVVHLAEWTEKRLIGVALTAADLRLCERLKRRREDTQVIVYHDQDGVVVKARGAVGVVRFDAFDVHIHPKFSGNAIGLFRLVAYTSGIEAISEFATAPSIRAEGEPLADMFVRLLTREVERIVRLGPRVDYVVREDQLTALRGRLLYERQVRERMGVFDRLICRFDELEHDVPDNQLLALALAQGSRIATSSGVRRQCAAAADQLAAICDPQGFDIQRGRAAITYDRLNEHYRRAHELAWIVLDALGPDEALRPGAAPARSFLIDLATIFERFVTRLLTDVLDPAAYTVQEQRRSSIYWRPDTASSYATVRPDVIVTARTGSPRRVPVDAKYKRYGDAPDTRSYGAADLSQAFVYAYAFRATDADSCLQALLVHPLAAPGSLETLELEVRSVQHGAVNARVTGVGVHIPTVLDWIKKGDEFGVGSQLREVIEAAVGSPQG